MVKFVESLVNMEEKIVFVNICVLIIFCKEVVIVLFLFGLISNSNSNSIYGLVIDR